MQVKRIYEAMFVVDTNLAAKWEQLEQTIRRLMDRANAELLYCKLWDDRRLAYEFRGRKRAAYVLVFFKSATDRLDGLERDVQLSEDLLRVLVVRHQKSTEDEIRKLAEGEGIVPTRISPHGFEPYGRPGPRPAGRGAPRGRRRSPEHADEADAEPPEARREVEDRQVAPEEVKAEVAGDPEDAPGRE